jgi:hypothetical protein
MRWQLDQFVVEGTSNSEQILEWWAASFSASPQTDEAPDIQIAVDVVPTVPGCPDTTPLYREGNFLAYYQAGRQTVAYLPQVGRLDLDLEGAVTTAQIQEGSLHPGSLEDLVAIGLSPHLRRRGLYLLHAFAAAREDRAVLLVGDMGAGKTTTGLALLESGWKLLANDSPMLDGQGQVFRYPGLISAYPNSFAHFSASAPLAEKEHNGQKIMVAAESLWPGVWAEQAAVCAVLFPQIAPERGHDLHPLTPVETVRRLLPHTMEQWDRETMGMHLAALRRLAERAPGYVLYLGPQVGQIGEMLEREGIG